MALVFLNWDNSLYYKISGNANYGNGQGVVGQISEGYGAPQAPALSVPSNGYGPSSAVSPISNPAGL